MDYNKDKAEFRDIVLAHIKRILEISSHELRDASREVHTGNTSLTIESEDTRIAYVQSIENLGYILKPYFDEQVSKVFEECISVIDAFGYEIKKEFAEELEEVKEESGFEKLDRYFVIEMKVKFAKKLFVELNLLLHRNDYLKSSIYGEGRDEVAEED
jgi:hypothetical protein